MRDELFGHGSNRVQVSSGDLKDTSVISQLTKDNFRTRQIVEDVAQAVARGRKIMVVSERLEHLRMMANDLSNILIGMNLEFEPVIDFYVGEWFTGDKKSTGEDKKRSRSELDLKIAEGANVLMATRQLCEEGLDVPALDVIVLATPMGDVEQVVGRGRRHCLPEKSKCERLCKWRAGICTGKPHPMVVDVVDENVPQAMNKWRYRLAFYKGIGSM